MDWMRIEIWAVKGKGRTQLDLEGLGVIDKERDVSGKSKY